MSDDEALVRARRGEEFRVRARSPLDGETLRRLCKLSPLRATASLAWTFGLVVAAVAAALSARRPLVVAAAILILAAAQHGLAILAHQAAHYRMYETRWLNDLVGRLCALPLGVSMVTYRVIHRLHHNHLYTALDPDLPLMAGYPRGRRYLARKLVKDLSGVTVVKNYLYFFGRPAPSRGAANRAAESRRERPLDDTSPELRRAARRDRALVVVVQLALLATAIATGALGWYLLLWVVPLATVLQAMLRLRAVCEHGAVPDESDPRRAARTTHAPWWITWWLFPHQMHFHVEHHLFPAVPHYRLRECHAALAAQGSLDGAEVVPRLRDTLARIFAEPPDARRRM